MKLPPLEDTPLVSVVMIFKDAAAFLDEAAASVLAQTWPSLELVLVDDGGTDGSDGLAHLLAARDPDRVRVLAHAGRANLGTGPSRLVGVRAARGACTAFLDADDRWEPGHLEHEVRLLLQHPDAGVVAGRCRVWRSWRDTGAHDELSPLPFAPGTLVLPPRLLAAVLRSGGFAVPTCSLLARTDVLQACADQVATFASTYEDQVINTLLQLRVATVMSGTTTAWYRQHDASLSARAQRSGRDSPTGASLARLQFVRWLDALPELAPGEADPELRSLLDEVVHEQREPRAVLRSRARTVLTPPLLLAARAVARASRRALAAPEAAAQVRTGVPGVAWSPVHEWYAQRFLHVFGEDLRGRVTQVGDGPVLLGPDLGVEHLRVLEDLQDARSDCVVVADALALAEDQAAAVAALRRAVRPGGAVLALLPGLRRVDPDRSGPAVLWTGPAARALFARAFDGDLLTVVQEGGARAAADAVRGRPPRARRLGGYDLSTPVLVAVRALVPR